jgi:hypothetical protein
MKWIKRIVIAVFVFLLVIVVAVYLSIDHVIKSVVESEGTEQLNVPTTLGSVDLGLISGTVDLNTLAIGSPKGFSAPQMFSVGKLNVATGGLMRLRNEPIHLLSITIDQPQLVVEQHGSKTNFRVLMDDLPKNPDQGGNAKTTASQSQPTKYIIDTLTVSNAHVLLKLDLPGLNKDIDVPIPAITMKNIGNADGANNGAAIKDVATTVITQMIEEATHSSSLPPGVPELLSGNLAGVQDKLTGEAQKQLDALKVPINVNGLLNQLSGKKAK